MSSVSSTALACAMMLATCSISFAQKGPARQPEHAQPEQTEPFWPSASETVSDQLTYDDLMALEPALQHAKCVAFLSILRNFVPPEEASNPDDPFSLDARTEVHAMWMFIHYAADHPGTQQAEISDILTPVVFGDAARYEERFLQNIQTHGEVWDDGLFTNELAFCVDLWMSTNQ